MRISEQPTEYVLLRVLVEGNWSPYHFAVMHLTDPWVFIMRQRLKALEPFQNDDTFYSATYHDEPMGYYACEEEDEIGQLLIELYVDDLTWCYVLLDDPEEYLNWAIPPNRPETHMLMISPEGTASYMCFSGYTDYEFATETFCLEEVLGC